MEKIDDASFNNLERLPSESTLVVNVQHQLRVVVLFETMKESTVHTEEKWSFTMVHSFSHA